MPECEHYDRVLITSAPYSEAEVFMNRSRHVGLLLLLVWTSTATAQRAADTDDRAAMLQRIDARRDSYATVAKQIWGFAEVGYQEEKSSALLQQQLRAAGFQVKAGVADIPTAFVATFGSGKPVIGIVGEFDALPGLSQEAQTATRHADRGERRPATAAATTCSAPVRSRPRSR